MMKTNFKRKAIAVLVTASLVNNVHGAPTLPQLVAGQATFGQQGNVFSITNTPNTIINWQSFSVNAGEITRFVQQSSDSAVLNRILGQDPSRILGALQSNGHVYLINPNGIMFGKDAKVDVNGLVASTLNISNNDFLAGKKIFSGSGGTISNAGSINGSKIFLIAQNVENSGVITSPSGEVVLAAGHSVELVDSGNPDLHVVLSAPADQAINLGQIVANRVGIYGALVNQRGVVNATAAAMEGGKVVFKASGDTLLEAGSVTTGSDIKVLGERVGLTGNAIIDASGENGGGTVLVGGDYHGENAAVQNATVTYFGKDAVIRADATGSGNGGKVVLWSDNISRVYGTISARGGINGGDGGFVETSGKVGLDFNARIDTGASKGKAGTVLLDPTDITIASGSGGADDGQVSVSDTNVLRTDLPANMVISEAALEALTGTIKLEASGNITLSDLSDNALTLSSGSSLSLDALGSIIATADVNDRFVTTGGAINFSAGGSINIGGVKTGGGAINMVSGTSMVVREVNSSGISGGNIALQSGGFMSLGGGNVDAHAIDGTTGNVTLVSGGSFSMQTDKLINANSLHISAVGGIHGSAATDPVSTNAITLNLQNTGTGVIRISNILQQSPTADYTVSQSGGGAVDLSSNGIFTIGTALSAAGSNVALKAPTVTIAGTVAASGGIVGISANQANIGGTLTVGSGAIGLLADSISLTGSLSASGGTVILQPFTASNSILIGGAVPTGPGSLWLDPVKLDAITGKNLIVGGVTGGTGSITVVGATTFSNLDSTGLLTLDAGAGALHLNAALTTPGTLLLKSTAAIDQLAPFSATSLSLVGNNVALPGSNTFGTVSALTSGTALSLRGAGAYTVGTAATANGIATSGGAVSLDGSAGIVVGAPINAGAGAVNISAVGAISDNGQITASDVVLSSSAGVAVGAPINAGAGVVDISAAGAISGGSLITAGRVALSAGAGIGVSQPLNLQTSYLQANNNASSSSPINIINTGTLTLGNVNQTGVGNGGSITIENYGGMTMPATDIYAESSGNVVSTTTGSISLTTHSPLTINGHVSSSTGNITLIAGNDGALTVGGNVTSSGGNIQLTGGTVTTTGTITTTSPGTVQRSLTIVPVPTLSECISSPTTSGCASVLPTLGQCTVTPTTAGCSVVLPSITTCTAAPTTAGCTAVLPTLTTCIATPTAAGCSAVLPPLSSCITTPTLAGCSVVLPTMATCIATPTAAGCGAVLPTLSACIAAPAAAGCSVVLPTMTVCIASPTTLGCSVVLPTLTQCILTPTATGCSVVLPTLTACIASPTTSGCAVVLPTLAACIATPTAAGCSVVLPTLAACIAAPSTVGCSVVLPTLSQCVATPTKSGCTVVLPTLAQCTVSPTLQGCSVVLPKLETCAANPTTAGCTAVLPAPTFCATHPTDPSCQAIDTGTRADTPVAKATNAVVAIINTVANVPTSGGGGGSTDTKSTSKTESSKTGAADSKFDGVKNEPVKKMYCN